MCHNTDCGCEQHSVSAPRRDWHHHGGGYSGCCGTGHAPRRFPTRAEIVERLEEYLKQLRAEAAGVEERITELKREG